MLKHLRLITLCIFLFSMMTVRSGAQSARVLWSNAWNVNFFFPQQVGFSSDSKYFALGYDKGDVVIFDAGTGEVSKTYHLHERHVFCTVFQPGGHLLVSGDKEGYMVIYDYVEGKEIKTVIAHDKAITAITFSKDGKLLVTGSNDNSIKIWDPTTGKLIRAITDVTGNIRALRLSNDNAIVIAGTSALSKGLRLFDAQTGAEKRTFESANLQRLDLSPDGTHVATANLDKALSIYDIAHFVLNKKLHAHTKNLTDVAYNNTGHVLYSSSNDRSVIAWDVVHGKPIKTIFESEKKIASIACSPDGKYLAIMDESSVFSVLDVSGFEEVTAK